MNNNQLEALLGKVRFCKGCYVKFIPRGNEAYHSDDCRKRDIEQEDNFKARGWSSLGN